MLDAVAYGSRDADVLSSLASRLARLERQLSPEDLKGIQDTAHGTPLGAIVSGLLEALDPDQQEQRARLDGGLQPEDEPSDAQVATARKALLNEAAAPLASNPALRQHLMRAKQQMEQTIDAVSQDELLDAGYSAAAQERARATVTSFRAFINEHKDEITALQVLYSRPYPQRLRYPEIKALADAVKAPPHAWTPEALWRAYETLDASKVHGSGGRVLTDLVSLVRFTLAQDGELVPFPERVDERFDRWLAQQEGFGRTFTGEQRRWLELMRDHIAANLQIEADDFESTPFVEQGGLGKVYQVFGPGLNPLLEELNQVLAA